MFILPQVWEYENICALDEDPIHGELGIYMHDECQTWTPGGTPRNKWLGLPETFSLCITKLCDFPWVSLISSVQIDVTDFVKGP